MSRNEVELTNQKKQEMTDHLKQLVRFVSSFYVLPLYLLFSLADYIWYRDEFATFLGLRLLTTGVVWLANFYVARQHSFTAVQVWASVFVQACIWPLNIMVILTGDAGTPYYAGLTLVVAGMAGNFRFSWGFYAFNLSQAILPMMIWGIFQKPFSSSSFFLLNLLFLISVSLIMTVTRIFNERLYDREMDLRNRLTDEIENRDSVIEMKTKEGLRLHSLSKQFSPQIIKSLQSGQLRLDGGVHRADICVILVDICDSTEKFIRLDRDDLQKILSMYMDDVMTTFLKYDITIDKFLGDAFLGFSNDPVQQKDYIERVIRAAIEIQNRVHARRDSYCAYWLGDFEIKIAITAGYASIGFYGSDLHVKSYTAIGRPVNLASRIEKEARPNEILISQEVLAKLRTQGSTLLSDLNFFDRGQPKMSGFESEKVRLYAIDPSAYTNSGTNDAIPNEVCPNGHGILHLEQNDVGLYYYKCRFCDYVHSMDQVGLPAQRTG